MFDVCARSEVRKSQTKLLFNVDMNYKYFYLSQTNESAILLYIKDGLTI